MPFDFYTPKSFYKKCARAVDWIVEEVILRKDWRSLRVLIESPLVWIDLILFLAFNPSESPFPNLLSVFPQLKQFGWYAAVFWSLVAVIFVIAVIVAAPADSKTVEPVGLKPGAIKGLEPFGYEDAEVFSHLQRDQRLNECLQAICDEQWRFGALSGESGAGKTSFLQAGLWPELEKRGLSCVYVKFSDADPFESVKRACLKHLSFANGAPDGADFHILLRAATAQDRTPIVLFFDQFEQFFVHRKRKKDREPFAQALAQLFAEMQILPIKILVCVRGDFFDRLNELQKAMRYSLSPTQSFRLERFEPDQATEIFCFLAEKEGIEYDREFISEMTRQELADAEDGLVSPVDIQALARMIGRRTAQEGRAFNRETLQNLGGMEGPLDQYLTTSLEPLSALTTRQVAINVLLALADLERDVRAGALTFEDLRQKLGGGLAESKLKDAVAFLAHSDASLISPSSENEEEKFELAHESLLPALRRLARKQLSKADRAAELLARRTNEWINHRRSFRYYLPWAELWLIYKHRRYAVRGKDRQAKEDLLAATRRFFIWECALLGLVITLFLFGRVYWHGNAWQTYLIKKYLYSQGFRLNDKEASIEIATALTYAGDSQLALRVVDRIGNYYYKADAMEKIAESYISLGDKDKSSALLSDMVKMAERIENDSGKAYALRKIAKSYVELGDNGKAESLLSEGLKVAERIRNPINKVRALSATAISYAGLGEKMKNRAMLEEAVKIADRISGDSSKDDVWEAIAKSYARLGVTAEDRVMLNEAVKMADRISDDRLKSDSQTTIVQSYVGLGEAMKDRAMLKEAAKILERAGGYRSNPNYIVTIAYSYARLGDKEKARALLEGAIKIADRSRINGGFPQASALSEAVRYHARLGEVMKDRAMLKEAARMAERIRINDGYSKFSALSAVVQSYARLGEAMKDRAVLNEAAKILERAGGYRSNTDHIVTIAYSYDRLGDKEKACALLEGAIKIVDRISDNQAKTYALNAIVYSYVQIGEGVKGDALLVDAIKIADRINDDHSKSNALGSIAQSYAKLGEAMKDAAMLNEAVKIADRIIGDDALGSIAQSYANLGEAMKDAVMLNEAVKIADRISDDLPKSKALSAIAQSYVLLGDKERARALLEDAIRKVAWIDRQNKPSALSPIIMSYAKLAESLNDPALLYDLARRLIGRPQSDSDRDQTLDAILSSKLALADVDKLRLLTEYYDNELGRIRALARILKLCSHPELIEKNRRELPPGIPPFPRHRPRVGVRVQSSRSRASINNVAPITPTGSASMLMTGMSSVR